MNRLTARPMMTEHPPGRVPRLLTRGALLLCTGLVAASCGIPDAADEPQGQTESQLFVAGDTLLWNNATKSNQSTLGTKATIPVCFAVRPSPDCPKQADETVDCEGKKTNTDNPLTLNQAALRTTIRALIEQSWAHAANIEFLNWGDCAIDPATNTHVDAQLASTIVIRFQQVFSPPPKTKCNTDNDCNKNTPHATCSNDLTRNCIAGAVDYAKIVGKNTTAPTVIQYNWPAIQSGTDFGNAIHEFGHALGFPHEWFRSDYSNPNDPNSGSCVSVRTVPIESAIALTTFSDPDSIMNYCNASNNKLSAGDVIGLQRAYGRKSTGSLVSFDGMCADIRGADQAIGTPIIGFPCRNQSNDRWFRDAGSQRLQANLAGNVARCLNVRGGSVSTSSPTPVISWVCDGGANEKVQFSFVEWHGMGNMCATATSTGVVMNPCDSTLAQRWTFLDGDPSTSLGFQQIRSASTSKCVSTATDAGSMGEELTLKPCSPTDRKQQFNYPGQGIIGFGNLCMNVLGGEPTPAGRAVGLWNGCQVVPRPFNEVFSLSGQAILMGQCLDSSNRNQVTVNLCTGASSQSWEFYL